MTLLLILAETVPTLPRMIPSNPDNPIHQLFALLGCDLDYVPIHKYEALLLILQFLAALWFIWWFVRFLYKLGFQAMTGGRIR